jgi:RNA polymerase sigma-70 factor (ECF subfamily)
MRGTSVPSENRSATSEPAEQAVFVTTQWSVIVAAGRADTPNAQAALERLCRSYWYPLYAYARRRGHSVEDAQDLTQAFFARLLERHWVADADRERGRFRTFLLTAMNRFMADEWDKLRAQKRGGGVAHVPLQLNDAETRYGCEPADDRTPEQYFERRWALTLLDTVLQRLRREYEQEGKGEVFAALHSTLGGSDSRSYAELGAQAGLSEGAVKVAVHRLRKRYRRLLRDEIAQTSAAGANVDEELQHLFGALSGP